MKVLVTGARGFLGREVVLALRRRAHRVRALDRAKAAPVGEAWPRDVEEFRADLCESPDLVAACQGMEAVIHLAAKLQGREEDVVESAVRGTERLLDAMERAGVRRMVLASSLSVYDWSGARGVLGEDSPLEPRPEARDGYAIAKIGQERIARDRCGRAGIALTLLRPGALWGVGREYPATVGQRLGPLHLLIAASRQLPTVHVENCADAFAAVLDAARGAEGAFDVIDHPEVTVRQFVADHLRRSGRFGLALPLAYGPCLACLGIAHWLVPRVLERWLPSFAAPVRFAARYKPVRIEGARLRRTIGWSPPLSYQECLDRTYGSPPRR